VQIVYVRLQNEREKKFYYSEESNKNPEWFAWFHHPKVKILNLVCMMVDRLRKTIE
jgi:hypothetical protein